MTVPEKRFSAIIRNDTADFPIEPIYLLNTKLKTN